MARGRLADQTEDVRYGSFLAFPARGIYGEPRRGLGKITSAAVFALVLSLGMLFLPPRAMAGGAAVQVSVGISVSFGPPPLPIYAQPMCPGPGYMWTPGYWAWDPSYGYYWVPGTWVLAPFPGALWTPGYWGWDPAVAVFIWHAGYWGPLVGFYGGINYGYGYTGYGYQGGYWRGRTFYYNRAVNRVDVYNITHVYDRTVVYRNQSHISYNGGRGGIMARPTREDFRAERERRMRAVRSQENHERMARQMPEMRWSRNHGRPDIAATRRPEVFRGRDVSRATRSGGSYTPGRQGRPEGRRSSPPRRSGEQPGTGRRQPAPQPRYRPTPERRSQPNTRQNHGPTKRNQGRPEYRNQPSRREQPQNQRGRGNQNRQENRGKKDHGNPGPPGHH